MARYEITAPNGQKFEINAPDDATQDQVMAYAQSEFSKTQQPDINQRNLEIPTPENLAISAAENQRLREANKQPEQDRSLADYPIGAADAAWSALTAGTTGLLGNIAGTLQQGGREVMSGQYGTNEAA